MENKPISSIDLMEEAATAVVDYLENFILFGWKVHVFCGPGNNGGDGLAIARLLMEMEFEVTTYLLTRKKGTPEYETNLRRLKRKKGEIVYLSENEPFPANLNGVFIDAIFGIGLNRPVSGFFAEVIEFINVHERNRIISIDIPSGMFADKSSKGNAIVKAHATFTFGLEKLAFYMPENGEYTGGVVPVDIGLLSDFMYEEQTDYQTVTAIRAHFIIKKRKKFAHKGDFGHACLIAGSTGMMGAAVLSAMGCLRSGAGKLTCHVPEKGYDIMQIRAPEALCSISGKNHITDVKDLSGFNVIGMGPGIGVHKSHRGLLEKVFEADKSIVLDADALNVLGKNKDLLERIPKGSILTPHPKEFERVFGKTSDDFAQRELALDMAKKYGIYIVLKGRYTFIATPRHDAWINNETGNPGMATGGTGDVLTGILTGLLAQNYSPEDACVLGVYLHGMAGDKAAKRFTEHSVIASDLYKYIGKSFRELEELEF